MRALSLLLLSLVACSRPPPPDVPRLRVSSEAEARALVGGFFEALRASEIDAALAKLCPESPARRAVQRAFLERFQAEGSPFRVERFSIERVEALWQAREPAFEVVVAFPRTRGPGQITHAYRVRAREGCLEDFLGGQGAPEGPPPHPLPPPHGPGEIPPGPAPVSEGDEIIEL